MQSPESYPCFGVAVWKSSRNSSTSNSKMKQRAYQVIYVQLLQVHTTLQPPEKAHSCVKAILPRGCPKPSAFFSSFLCFCVCLIIEDIHREMGFLVSGSPSAPAVYFLQSSQFSCNEFQHHDHTDGSSHGEHAGKPPWSRKQARRTQRTPKTWERAEGGPMFHEAPTNEGKSGKQDSLQQHIPPGREPGDPLCKALLGHCTLPVRQSQLPLGSLVGPRSCAGLVLMQPVLAGQRRPQELAEGINLTMGFQKLKSFEVDLPMPSLSVSMPPATSSTYLSNELLE